MDEEDDQRHYLRVELYKAMRNSTEFFDFLQLGSLDGIWFRDLEVPEQEWRSPQFWLLLGYNPSEKKHLVSEWEDLIFPEDLETCNANMQMHLDNPDHPYDQVVRYRHKMGHTVWTRCRGLAQRHPDTDKPIRMLGAHQDMTAMVGSHELVGVLRVQIEALKMQIEAISMQNSMAKNRVKTLEQQLSAAKKGNP